MGVLTGWLVTDEARVSGSDMFSVPEKGVLKVQGRTYRFGAAFPQGTAMDTVYREMSEATVHRSLQQGVACCQVVCGERDRDTRLDLMFGLTGKDGLAPAHIVDLLSETSPDAHEVKFSFTCLKETGVEPVDLLKNINPDKSKPPSRTEGDGPRFFPVRKLNDFSSIVMTVLRSPTFQRCYSTLSLLIAITVRSRSALRETTFSLLDVAPCHMHSHGILDGLDHWRRVSSPDPAVPAFFTYPIRTSGRISVLACHPSGPLQQNTMLLLQQVAKLTPEGPGGGGGGGVQAAAAVAAPPPPSPGCSPIRSAKQFSPPTNRASVSVSPLPETVAGERDISPSRGDFHIVAKLRKQLQASDMEISKYKGVITEYENQLFDLESHKRRLKDDSHEVVETLRRDLAAERAAGEALKQQLCERHDAHPPSADKRDLLPLLQEAEADRDDMERRLALKDSELQAKDIEVERLRKRIQESQIQAERLMAKEVALRDLEKHLNSEHDVIKREMDARQEMREATLQRQYDMQAQSEQARHERTLRDKDSLLASLEREIEHLNNEHALEATHFQSKLSHANGMLEQTGAELAELRTQIPQLRQDEANQVAGAYEARMQDQYTALNKLELKVEEYESAMQEMKAAHGQEHDALVEILQAERTQGEEDRLKQIEENARRESELATETSRMRNEIAIAQAEALKANRVYEAKEMELQGLQHLAKETDEVRIRNAELERLLRESQHYGKMQQFRRDLETAYDVLECLRVRLVPSWCADWARLGRVKDLKEHLVTRTEELTLKVRTSDTCERDQRVREVALVAEHEQTLNRLADQGSRSAVIEQRNAELDTQLQTLRTEHSKAAHELGEARRVIESLANVILLNDVPVGQSLDDATAGMTPLGEGWMPSVEMEVWLADTTRQIIIERNTYRDADADKTHALQELQVRCSQLQSENEIVNQNVKEMTTQIMGCTVETPRRPDPPGTGLRDSREYISMAPLGAIASAATPPAGAVDPKRVESVLSAVNNAAAAQAEVIAATQPCPVGAVLTSSVPAPTASYPPPVPTVPSSLPPRPVVMMSPAATCLPVVPTTSTPMPLRDRADLLNSMGGPTLPMPGARYTPFLQHPATDVASVRGMGGSVAVLPPTSPMAAIPPATLPPTSLSVGGGFLSPSKPVAAPLIHRPAGLV